MSKDAVKFLVREFVKNPVAFNEFKSDPCRMTSNRNLALTAKEIGKLANIDVKYLQDFFAESNIDDDANIERAMTWSC